MSHPLCRNYCLLTECAVIQTQTAMAERVEQIPDDLLAYSGLAVRGLRSAYTTSSQAATAASCRSTQGARPKSAKQARRASQQSSKRPLIHLIRQQTHSCRSARIG